MRPVVRGERVRRSGLRLLSAVERLRLRPELLEVVEYRKSGLSLNWIIGCPLNCGYCVRTISPSLASAWQESTKPGLRPGGEVEAGPRPG